MTQCRSGKQRAGNNRKDVLIYYQRRCDMVKRTGYPAGPDSKGAGLPPGSKESIMNCANNTCRKKRGFLPYYGYF